MKNVTSIGKSLGKYRGKDTTTTTTSTTNECTLSKSNEITTPDTITRRVKLVDILSSYIHTYIYFPPFFYFHASSTILLD